MDTHFSFTRHSQNRAKQRHLPDWSVDAILTYGEIRRAPGHAELYLLSATAMAELCADRPELKKKIRQGRSSYAIVKDNWVITLGYWDKRRIRH